MQRNTTAATAEQPAQPWPATDFLRRVDVLREQLKAAWRNARAITEQIRGIQENAERARIPVAALIGPAMVRELAQKQEVADLAVNEKRNELRNFLQAERARFFAIRDAAHTRLRSEIAAQFERARAAAAELREVVSGRLGADEEIRREEAAILEWNRAVKRANRSIPQLNLVSIPSAQQILAGDSLRNAVEGMLLQDSSLREFVRDVLRDDAEKRARKEFDAEAALDLREREMNPF